MKVVFCGTGDIGAPALEALLARGRHTVIGVITQPDKPAGRDLKPRQSAIKRLALAHNLPVQQPENLRSPSAIDDLRGLAPDIMVVAAYGQILSSVVLGIPPFGCVNLHASLLPRHRGASPIQATILGGDTESGISVMQMDEGLDTGPVLLQKKIHLPPSITAGELHDCLAALAVPALLEALDGLAAGTLRPVPQDPAAATTCGKLRKPDGFLRWQLPAPALERTVRAMSPWPGAFLSIGGGIIKVHSATVADASAPPGTVVSAGTAGLEVAAATGSLLITRLQGPGRRAMPAGDFLRGHPVSPGTVLDLSFPPPA